jgi:hypothetical protein
MTAQIIILSDRRKRRPTTSSTMVDLPISVFAAYAEICLAIYLSMVGARTKVSSSEVCRSRYRPCARTSPERPTIDVLRESTLISEWQKPI